MSLPPPESDYWNTVPLRDAYMAWRLETVSVERVEKDPLFEREEPIRPSYPAWVALKKQIKPGDELWTFDSPQHHWKNGMGWCGLVLVRQGEFVDACVIMMN
jgi:hypothetical protein